MKKSSKPFIVNALALCVAAAMLILLYVSVKLQCESLVKEKVETEINLRAKKNWQLNLTVQCQSFTSEEYIVPAAQEGLGMIKGNAPVVRFNADREKIERIQKEIDSRYE